MNHVHGNYWQARGKATPFSGVLMPSWRHCSELQLWLDQMISQHGGPEKLVSKTVDFTDLRVREFTKDEIHGNRDFLEVSEEMAEITFKIQVKQIGYHMTSDGH
jgi:hypothetical protein